MNDVPLLADESITSYASRLAAREWADSGRRYLSEVCGYDVGPLRLFPQNSTDADAAADALGIPRPVLRDRALLPTGSATRLFFGIPIPSVDLERNRRRFAPASLSLKPHARAVWQLRLFPFCEESWQFLTDACGRCGAVQRWTRSYGTDACDICLEPLREAPADVVPEDIRHGLSLALGLVHPEPARRRASMSALPKRLRTTPSDVYGLLTRLLPVVEHRLDEKPQRIVSGDPHLLASAMSEAWSILENWPDAALRLFDQRLDGATSQHSDGNHGRSTRLLSASKAERLDPKVTEWIAELRRLVTIDEDDRTLQGGLVPVMESRKRLGLVGFDLSSLRKRNFLGCVMRVKSGRACTFHREDEVRSLELQLEDRLTAASIGERLGIATYGAEDLIRSQLIQPYFHPFFEARFGEPMTGSTAFEEFVIRLDAAAASPENVGHTLPLAKLLQAIGGRLKPWHAVTELLLSGALIFTIRSGNQRLFSRIHIEASGPMQLADLTASVVAGSTPAHISARDLGEILNLSPSASTKVARLIAIDRSSKKNVIRLEDAIGLANRFISLVEVSARLGCSPRAARLLLDRAGIRREHAAGYSRAEAESLIRVQSHRPSTVSRNALPA